MWCVDQLLLLKEKWLDEDPEEISVLKYVATFKDTVKPEKNTTIKFHENALKQFSRRLKFTNLASEPQKNSNLPFYVS